MNVLATVKRVYFANILIRDAESVEQVERLFDEMQEKLQVVVDYTFDYAVALASEDVMQVRASEEKDVFDCDVSFADCVEEDKEEQP